MLTKVFEGCFAAAFAVAALLGLAWAVQQGWLMPMGVGLLVLGYGSLALFSVGWTIQIGSIGAQQQATVVSKLLWWHGLGVLLTLILAAAGSIMLLFGRFALRGL